MTTIQVVGVQHPAGRGRQEVRVFGYRSLDPDRKVVEVLTTVDDAVDLIAYASANREFPEIEVEDRRWTYCVNSGGVKTVHLEEPSA